MHPLKKIAALGALLTSLGTAQAVAGLLVEERFDYAKGASISGKAGGKGFAGNWMFGRNETGGGSGTITMGADGAIVAGTKATWATRTLAIQSRATPSFYFSYAVSSVAVQTLTANSFLDALVFKTGAPGGYTTVFQSGMHYGATSGLRLRVMAGGTEATLLGAAQTAPDIVYTVVGKFTFDDGANNATLSMWVNPKSESAPPVFSRVWASGATNITQLVLQRFDDKARAAGCATAFDEVRIGTDWASVAGAKAE